MAKHLTDNLIRQAMDRAAIKGDLAVYDCCAIALGEVDDKHAWLTVDEACDEIALYLRRHAAGPREHLKVEEIVWTRWN